MTETQSKYITPGSHNMSIPTREEFHRYASDILSKESFNTQYPNGHVIENIARSLRWTTSHTSHNYFNLKRK